MLSAFEPVMLTGQKIRLEPLRMEHHAALCAVGLDPALWRLTRIRLRTPAELEAYMREALEAQRAGTALPFVLVERGSGAVIGSTRYHSIELAHCRLEIGYSWVASAWQRSGANLEAKYLLLRHAFEAYGYERVQFKADARNDVSRRSLERLGARQEAILRRYVHSAHRGAHDMVLFSILAAEWPAVKLALQERLGGAGRRT